MKSASEGYAKLASGLGLANGKGMITMKTRLIHGGHRIGHRQMLCRGLFQIWLSGPFVAFALLAFALVLVSPLAQALVVYVDKDATGANNGTSWADAFTTIQPGIDAAFAGGGGEVWIAEGAYSENRVSDPHGDGTNTGSVVMKPSVQVYGGFIGNETTRSERDWSEHLTIIDGSTSIGGITPAFHVVVGANNSRIDGFTVTGGHAPVNSSDTKGGGAGMYNDGVTPVVDNCQFSGNTAEGYGGGMCNRNNASPDVVNCKFISNNAYADGGGGMFNNNSSPSIRKCLFQSNNTGYRGGAGIRLAGPNCSPTIEGCTFIGNVGCGGGGIFSDSSSPTLSNCLFIDNVSFYGTSGAKGGALHCADSNVTIINCTFVGNRNSNSDPGRWLACDYRYPSTVTVRNSIIWDGGSETYDLSGSTVIVTFSDINVSWAGAGNIDSDPAFLDPANKNYRLLSVSPCIDAGTASSAPGIDIEGNPRPVDIPGKGSDGPGLGFDIGAYEFGVAITTPVQSDCRYENDEVQRLTKVSNNQGITIPYTYDDPGNRTAKIVTSQLTVAAGPASPVSHGIGNNAVDEPILQLALSASADENLALKGLEFQTSGTGNDATAISEVKLWNGGVVLGTSSALDNGTVAFGGLSETILAGSTANLLLTYKFQGASLPAQQGDTFHAAVTDHLKVIVDGSVSGNHIYALGLPVDGATLTISTDTVPPTFAGLTSATAQDGAVMLEWPEASDGSVPITYRIWQATSSFGGTVNGAPTCSTRDLSYLVPGLVNGQTYYFVVRSEDSVGNRDENTVECSAVPQAMLYSLTVTAGPHGSVSGVQSDMPFEAGSQVLLTATGDGGYHLVNWTGHVSPGGDAVNPLTVVMDGDKGLTANFTRSTGTVGVNATPTSAPWSFLDGDGVTHPAGAVPVASVPTGDIQLTWQPLDGYLTPAQPAPQTLGKDGYVTFTGVYAPVLASAAPVQNERHYVGETAEFTVQASGGLGTLHYQWKFDDHQSGVAVVGGDAPVLTIADAQSANVGDYWCVITDAAPQTLTSNVATLGVAEHLAFSTPLPPTVTGYFDNSVTLRVGATGGFEPLSYQWFKDQAKTFVPIGTDSPELTLDDLSPEDETTYRVQVSDDNAESIESSTDLLLVSGAPAAGLVGIAALIGFLVLVGMLGSRRQTKQ